MPGAYDEPMRWPELEQNLASVFADLTERCFLVVRDTTSSHFVQVLVGDTWLYSEAPGNSRLAEPDRISPTDESRMLALNWQFPDRARDTWSTYLGLPADYHDYRLLARLWIKTLHDIDGVSTPEQLTYQAWRMPEPRPGVFRRRRPADDPLDPGDEDLYLPGLGLRRTAGH